MCVHSWEKYQLWEHEALNNSKHTLASQYYYHHCSDVFASCTQEHHSEEKVFLAVSKFSWALESMAATNVPQTSLFLKSSFSCTPRLKHSAEVFNKCCFGVTLSGFRVYSTTGWSFIQSRRCSRASAGGLEMITVILCIEWGSIALTCRPDHHSPRVPARPRTLPSLTHLLYLSGPVKPMASMSLVKAPTPSSVCWRVSFTLHSWNTNRAGDAVRGGWRWSCSFYRGM